MGTLTGASTRMPETVMNHLAALKSMLCFGLMLCMGCDGRVSWMDSKEEAGPLMQRAALRANEGNVDSAIRLYGKVLQKDNSSGRAHLDLALLLHDHKKDYVGAIYHYKRYLDLRPPTEKRDMIKGRIRLAEQLFAATIMVPGKQYDRISDLQAENMKLRTEIDRLGRRLAAGPKLATAARETKKAPRQDTSRPVITYRVKRGDTLSSIATSLYGDVHRWKEIQIANADILGNSEVVKVGQLLIIP